MTDPVHEACDNAHKTRHQDFEVTAVFNVTAPTWEEAIRIAQDDLHAGDWDAN